VRALGLDVGERHVGVAISDPSGTVVRPLQTIARGSREQDVTAIVSLVAEHDVKLIVVGQPLSLNSAEGPQARRVARYADMLAERLSIPVVSWDERFTTMAAEEILFQSRGRKKRQRARKEKKVDAIAAAVILQSYLDSQNGGLPGNNEQGSVI
jgi:putative Holliday junction resolvase